jgi:lipase
VVEGPPGLHVVRSGPEHGAGLRVVIVHGAMDRSTSFGRTVRFLDDVEVIRYDRRGYGKSIDLGVGTMADHVADLAAVLDGGPAAVVGHSIGGVVALALAQQRPDLVPSVAAFEAPMAWADWWPSGSAGGSALAGAADGDEAEVGAVAAERFMRGMIGQHRWERLPPWTRAARRDEGLALLADLRSLRTDEPPYEATALTQPVTAAYGTESRPHHIKAAVELARMAPRSELVIFDGSDHGAHLTHPKEFADFVRSARTRATERAPGGLADPTPT